MLAAGAGERFGPAPKMLALLRGKPLVAHALDTVRAARERGIVTGGFVVHQAGDRPVADLARAHGLEPLACEEWGGGLSQSLRHGVAALGGDDAAALILLGDQPLVTVAAIETVIAVGSPHPEHALVRSRYHDAWTTPSHPVLIGRSFWPFVLDLTGDHGFGPAAQAAGLHWTEAGHPGKNPDVDTIEDLMNLEKE
ncbi:MAG: nucleotidyltransferase family protein [Gemmatimonadota bacterium]